MLANKQPAAAQLVLQVAIKTALTLQLPRRVSSVNQAQQLVRLAQ